MNDGFAEANDGTMLDLRKLSRSLTYNANRTLNYEEVTHPNTHTYRMTFTYNSDGSLASSTGWVKQ